MTPRRGLALLFAVLACLVASFLSAVPAYAAAPTIKSFKPASGPVGTTVTIAGTGFAAPATVMFNGVAATSPAVVSATKITATVPTTATTGKISVTTGAGTATSANSYTVTAGAGAGAAATLSPTTGSPTTTTTVSLSGFAASEAVDIYVDTTEAVLAVTDNAGLLSTTIKIPASATPGVHYVTAVGRRSGSAAQATFTVRTNWYQAGFDSFGTGNNPYENVLSPTTVGKLRELWRFAPGAVAMDTPVVSANVVYAAFGDGTVRAVDAVTGAQRWSRQINGTFLYSPPTVLGNTLYIGSTDGNLYAINTANGAVQWTFTTGNGIYSGPRVVNNTVYFGSYDTKLYALNAATGALKWSYATGNAIFATPVTAGNSVYISSLDGKIYSLNATTGAFNWSYATSGAAVASVVVGDGLVYAASEDKTVVALSPTTGAQQWTYTMTNAVDGTPSLDEGVLFVGDISGTVAALDAGDGTVRWTRNLSATSGVLPDPIATANDVVYVGSPNHTFALAESNGAKLRTLPAGGNPSSAIVADGTVTVATGSAGDQGLVRYALPPSAQPSLVKRPVPSMLKPTR
jgi:outer membrane protein assembly factor BamB